jgi:hypothetical protein
MITGDNPLTAASIAAEAGVDDFMAEASPEDKLELIRKEQAAGRMVAMTGDGTNDAPALAQADVGVAMNTGTMAAKEAGNMVDLDSNPTKLIEIVEIGKQLLMTREPSPRSRSPTTSPSTSPSSLRCSSSRFPARGLERHAARDARIRHPLRRDLQRHRHHRSHLRWRLRSSVRPRGAAAILRRNMLIYGGEASSLRSWDQGDRPVADGRGARLIG